MLLALKVLLSMTWLVLLQPNSLSACVESFSGSKYHLRPLFCHNPMVRASESECTVRSRPRAKSSCDEQVKKSSVFVRAAVNDNFNLLYTPVLI